MTFICEEWKMYLQKVIGEKRRKKFICYLHLEGHWRKEQDRYLDPDPLVRGTDPIIRIRIRTKSVTDLEHCFRLICIWKAPRTRHRVTNPKSPFSTILTLNCLNLYPPDLPDVLLELFTRLEHQLFLPGLCLPPPFLLTLLPLLVPPSSSPL